MSQAAIIGAKPSSRFSGLRDIFPWHEWTLLIHLGLPLLLWTSSSEQTTERLMEYWDSCRIPGILARGQSQPTRLCHPNSPVHRSRGVLQLSGCQTGHRAGDTGPNSFGFEPCLGKFHTHEYMHVHW